MLDRILSLLIALAVLLAPAGMIGGNAAMAMPHDMAATAPMDHCSEQRKPAEEQAPESCCVMACAALPAESARLSARPLKAPPAQTPLLVTRTGLDPEAVTPPPRFS